MEEERKPNEGHGSGPFSDEHRIKSDIRMVSRAFRQDWPIPPEVQAQILQRIAAYLDREHPDGARATDRIVLGAAKVVGTFSGLSLQQQSLDLQREKQDNEKGQVQPISELVALAKERAMKRKAEREKKEGK